MSSPEFTAAEFTPADRALLAQAARWLEGNASHATPGNDLDLATAVEYLRISQAPANAEFARTVAAAPAGGPRANVRIGLVPGAFYREHNNTGADGALVIRILASLGHHAELVPVHSFGSLADNARIIRHWVDQQPGRPVILISLSKGACDVKTMLHPTAGLEPPRLAAWISLSGISTGTPLVAWLRRRPWRWLGVWLILKWQRQRPGVLHELRHGTDAPLAHWPVFPPGLHVVHVHGFPLSRHLNHSWAGKGYRRLAPLGPNDGGGVLLAEVGRWPGLIVPLWGVDHYMQPRHDIATRLRQVFQVVLARCG